MKASIVILDFRKSQRVCENVESLQRQRTNFDYEILIIDNSCTTENAEKLMTLKKFPNVRDIQINPVNNGYTRANNQEARKARGEFLMIVNPDIVWAAEDTLQKMVDYMEKYPEVGIMGPKQINDSNGGIAMSVRAFPNFILQVARRTFLRHLPILKQLVAYDEMQHLDYEKLQTVDWLQSSFWIVRRALWEKWGGLDESYFIFMSDPALCFRCWDDGYQVIYNPDVVVHADGRRVSSGGFMAFWKNWILRQHVKDALVYQLKHWWRGNPHKRWLKAQGLGVRRGREW